MSPRGRRAVFPIVSNVELPSRAGVACLRLGVEALGALVIAVDIVLTIVALIRRASGAAASFNPIPLQLARYFALALELQLAADILAMAIAPGWEQIGIWRRSPSSGPG